ncbi:MAG: outer membrane protein [Idiomarinaceae bacterium HL-53]|nr:MAG: outer membrane protein [Idiomarinaceae bacterium HL-53]
MKKIVLPSVCLSLAWLSHAPAYAQESREPMLSVGVAAIISDDAYRSQENTSLLVPALSYESQNWYFRGIELGLRPQWLREYNLTFTLNFNPSSYDPDENADPQLAQLDKRDNRFDAGLRYQRDALKGEISAEFTVNARDLETGYAARVSYGYPLSERPFAWQLTPNVGVSYLSDDLANSRYGISESEALRSGLPFYQPNATVSLDVGLNGYFRLNERWTLAGFYRIELLEDQVAQSPMLSEDTNQTILLFLTYTF